MKTKRFLSVLLTLTLIIGLLPVMASAAEGDKVSVTIGGETTYYTSIKDAVAKANESGNATITLLQDTTTGERLDITNSATLDLNGNTLSCTAYFADDYETMVAITTNNTKLTIIDSVGGGKLDGTGTDYALMLGEPGAYTARSASAYIDGSTVSGSVKTVSGTSMTVSGSTVESNSVVATIDMTNETTLNVFNSQILNTHSSSAASAIDNIGTLTITDSTISGSIGVDNRGTANISGNTNITGTVCSVKSRVESQDSTLTITGGNYTGGINITGGTATISGGSYTGGIVVSGGTATISDGTITESSAENAVEVSGSAELTISGGTFSATAGETYDTGVYVHNGGTVIITGGTITSTAYGVYNEGGSATITGGSISGGTVDLQVVGSDSILNLTLDEGKTVGATFPGGITAEGITLAELLATDTAAYWGVVDGKDTMLTVADAATGITDKGDITIRAICDHKDVKLDYITTETTHTPVCSVCNWTGEATEHTGGTATCQDPAVCEACGVSYGDKDANIHTPTEGTIFTDNGDGTHSYTCACGAAVAEVPHTLDVTTGKCVCGADMTAIATVTDGTNTCYAADAATLNQAVTAILETGSRTFTVELPADAEAGMITAIRRAICDTEGVADGSIHLTLKGVTSIPGTTNWDGVAFGTGDIYDEAGEFVDLELVTQLASINLPDVTEIGAQAFYHCENLVSVSAPKAQTIGAQAFGYTALTSVEFPELTTIPTDMFGGAWTLSSAKFPKVTTIEQNGLMIGGKFTPENNPTPFPLELTAEGDITFNGSNHFNIADQNYSGKVDLVLCCDKKDAVTFQEDGTATWQVREDLSYTFKSITFKHSYVDGKCTACGEDCAHTGGTATCTTLAVCEACGVSYGAVDTTNHDFSVEYENGFCPNGCYEPATLNAEGYYEIDNAGKLFWFAQQVNVEGNREIKGVLTAHIDLENRPWTPIGETGEENNNFRGIFDGQNHTIKGLYVEGGRAGLGFFGEVRTGTVKNFTIYGEVVVNTEVDYVGGVIGSICGVNGETDLERNGAIIQNITSYVNLTAKAHGVGMIGGFVGYANHQSLIENCSWYGTFDAGIYRVDSGAGGFIGKIQENTSEVTIRNCAAYGTFKTNYEKNSYNNTPTIYMGGFLSFSNTGAKTTLENCLFAGKFEKGSNLTDEARLGAFGTLRSVNSIKNCYYLGDDGLEAVHSDSNLKPGSDNVEITSVTKEQLASGEVAYKLGEAWGQDLTKENSLPVLGGDKVYLSSGIYHNEVKEFGILSNGTNGTKATATVAIPTAGTYTLIFADYEETRLNNVDLVTVTAESDKTVIIVPSEIDITLGKDDKIMLWQDMTNLIPLCEAYIVK